MGIDDARQGVGIGLGAQIPGAGPGELCVAYASGGVRHTLQAQVGRPGEDSGEECDGTSMQASGAQIREGVKEARLHTHVPQQVGDADTRHEGVDGVIEAPGGVRRAA